MNSGGRLFSDLVIVEVVFFGKFHVPQEFWIHSFDLNPLLGGGFSCWIPVMFPRLIVISMILRFRHFNADLSSNFELRSLCQAANCTCAVKNLTIMNKWTETSVWKSWRHLLARPSKIYLFLARNIIKNVYTVLFQSIALNNWTCLKSLKNFSRKTIPKFLSRLSILLWLLLHWVAFFY